VVYVRSLQTARVCLDITDEDPVRFWFRQLLVDQMIYNIAMKSSKNIITVAIAEEMCSNNLDTILLQLILL